MDSTPAQPPSGPEGGLLHRRLLDGDPTAPRDLYHVCAESLVAVLRTSFPRADDHLILSAVHETLVALCREPESYHPADLELLPYLNMAARCDYQNLLAKEQRRQRLRVPWKIVEDGLEDGNIEETSEEPLAEVLAAEERERLAVEVREISADWTEPEKRVLELLVEGERCTEAYAKVLALTHLSQAEQEHEVKRMKDRLKLRLKRARANDE
jgi:DNA-directed RNA polymerase specialized sigma24 family protein